MNINSVDLREDIIDSYNDEMITKEQAENLLKKYDLGSLK
jgi:hypothetical protein